MKGKILLSTLLGAGMIFSSASVLLAQSFTPTQVSCRENLVKFKIANRKFTTAKKAVVGTEKALLNLNNRKETGYQRLVSRVEKLEQSLADAGAKASALLGVPFVPTKVSNVPSPSPTPGATPAPITANKDEGKTTATTIDANFPRFGSTVGHLLTVFSGNDKRALFTLETFFVNRTVKAHLDLQNVTDAKLIRDRIRQLNKLRSPILGGVSKRSRLIEIFNRSKPVVGQAKAEQAVLAAIATVDGMKGEIEALSQNAAACKNAGFRG